MFLYGFKEHYLYIPDTLSMQLVKMKISTIVAIITVSICHSSSLSAVPTLTEKQALQSNNTSCDPTACLPACADPVPTIDGDCCPRCDNSTCLFKGCVHWNSLGVPQWFPEPCTTCSCLNGRPLCSQRQCQIPDCFGFPAKIKTGSCCAECDFGVATNSCEPVPYRRRTISIVVEGGSCSTDVVVHKCDKSIVILNGRTYACSGEERNVSTNVANCFAQRVVYKDVVQCQLRSLPVMDYDPDPYSCQLYIK